MEVLFFYFSITGEIIPGLQCDRNSGLAIQRWRCFALFQIQRGYSCFVRFVNRST